MSVLAKVCSRARYVVPAGPLPLLTAIGAPCSILLPQGTRAPQSHSPAGSTHTKPSSALCDRSPVPQLLKFHPSTQP